MAGDSQERPSSKGVLHDSGAVIKQRGSGTVPDPYPLIKAAGYAPPQDTYGTRQCVHPDSEAQRVAMLQFSQSRLKQTAAGVDGSAVRTAGRPMRRGDEPDVRELLDQVPQSRLKQFLHDEREKLYKSTRTKPLGRRSLQGVHLPESTRAPSFRFGIKQTTDEMDAAKKLIFPQHLVPSDEAHELRTESRGAYFRGRRGKGSYPEQPRDLLTSYGKCYSWELNGAKKCFSQPDDTKVVSKAVEEFRRITHPPVGKSALSITGRPKVPEEFVFGKPLFSDFSSAADCLRGSYSIDEQLPDRDLGRSRCSRAAKPFSHGSPDCETGPSEQEGGSDPQSGDREKREFAKRRRVNRVNPGDELGVGQLLTPQQYEAWGVLDEDFLTTRTRGELSELVTRSVGLSYGDEPVLQNSVNAAVARCAASYQSGADEKATASLMDVLNVYSMELDKRIAEETGSLTQTTRLKIL